MSKFGGLSQFGTAQFGGDPFGLQASFVVDRMADALDSLKAENGGPLRTVDTLTSDPADLESLRLQLQSGLPAVLIGYDGGSISSEMTTQLVFSETMNLVALCICDDLRSRTERLAGRSIYKPGLWHVMRWVTFLCGRALNRVQLARKAGPRSASFVAYEPGVFIGRVDFSCEQTFDLYDDIGTPDRLKRLGIVHTPTDLEQLFEDDNITPNTEDPTSLPGPGVAELLP